VRTGSLGSADAARLAEMAQLRFAGLWPALCGWARGLFDTGIKMFLVLVAIFVVLEWARRYDWMERILRAISRLTRFIGLKKEAGMPWLAGNVFGIVFGAGVITETVREGQLDSKQVALVATFLALCHGLFEDTAIFMVIGSDTLHDKLVRLFWIIVPRLVLASVVTWVLAKVVKEPEGGQGAKGSRIQAEGENGK
jgi:spore maturation protein SpmB